MGHHQQLTLKRTVKNVWLRNRYNKNSRMRANAELAKIVQLDRGKVISYAREVFGNPRKAHSWLTTPNPTLHDMQPKDLLEWGSPDDVAEVFNELERIDQGLF